jgi:hypothetical protein
LTGLTEAEFPALRPHVEPSLAHDLDDRTLDGPPRTSRRSSPDETCPFPTTADKRLFLLTYVTQPPLPEVQGQLVGMSPSTANQWIHRRHPVWNQALADQARLPARTADDVAAMLTTPPTEASAPSALFVLRGPNDQSSVRKTRRRSKRLTGGRENATRANTAS